MNTHMAHPKPRPGQPRTAYYFLICGTQKLGKGVDGAGEGGRMEDQPTLLVKTQFSHGFL